MANGGISYSDYNEGSLNRSIYPSTDRPSPPLMDPEFNLIKPSSTGSLVMEPFISMVRYLVYPGLVANH